MKMKLTCTSSTETGELARICEGGRREGGRREGGGEGGGEGGRGGGREGVREGGREGVVTVHFTPPYTGTCRRQGHSR